ncbi:MAG: HindVP family restriction endonuclease [Planctomycetes bacterium]|nr:HindVP family restriction endonuclease [Planctomycetota bacterium]
MPTPPEPSLYGIGLSNRRGDDLWGKNQFNGCFPAALACWMRDNRVSLLQVTADDGVRTEIVEVDAGEALATKRADRPFYNFESPFEPYRDYLYDPENIERADLVIGNASASGTGIGDQLRPFEIKLTTVPDNTTLTKPECEWAPELVVRPSTTMHCALGLFHTASVDARTQLREIVEPICQNVNDWGHQQEMLALLPRVIERMQNLQACLAPFQTPLVLQPVWKTKGKSPHLADNAFDIFLWTDLALLRVVADRVNSQRNPGDISRHARALLRVWRILFEVTRVGRVQLANVFEQMTYGHQSDKEFALSGAITHSYLHHPRLLRPAVTKDRLRVIILNGGHERLSPERRFDQTVVLAAAEIFPH